MTTTAPILPPSKPASKYQNAAEWWHALGDVPLERVVMNPPPGTATEQDLLRFVDRDKRLVELIDGTLLEKPVGSVESRIAMRLGRALGNFVFPRRLGLLSGEGGPLRMGSGRVRLPDLAFVAADDLPGRTAPREPIPTLRPTLAVEVLSEGNTKAEMRQKVKEYFESGSKLVWLIDPSTSSIAIYDADSEVPARTLREHEVLDGGNVLPGFTVPVADLFREEC